MRLIKMFGLAAVTAMAAMAFVGATSASAANTQLCDTHDAATALTCDSAATGVSINNTGLAAGAFLNSLVEILCLDISGSATPLALASPQSIHFTAFSFAKCGTRMAHENCSVTVINGFPLAELNKIGLDSGVLTWADGEILFNCVDIDTFGIDIHCVYDATGLQLTVGAQHLTANKTPIDKISGSLCPISMNFDALLKTTANRYVLA